MPKSGINTQIPYFQIFQDWPFKRAPWWEKITEMKNINSPRQDRPNTTQKKPSWTPFGCQQCSSDWPAQT